MSTVRRLTPITDDARLLARWTGVGLLATVAAASLLLAERRLAGALTTPLPALALVMIAAVLAAWSRAVRALTQDYFVDASPWVRKWLLRIAPFSAPIIASASLSLPGTSWGGLALLWGIVTAEEFLRPTLNRPPRREPASITRRECLTPEIEDVDEQESPPMDGAPNDESIVEQMVRRREASGAECVSGWLRVPFVPDQQTAITHLAFCPPLEKTPRFAAEPVDSSGATIKPTHLFTHGARLEIKLDRPASAATNVLVEFSAWTE